MFWHNLDVPKVTSTTINSRFSASALEFLSCFRKSRTRGSYLAILVLLLGTLLIFGRIPAVAENPATITFSLDFPNSDPEHYSMSVQSDGRAKYESSAKISKDSEA